jgi:hypothetical protein
MCNNPNCLASGLTSHLVLHEEIPVDDVPPGLFAPTCHTLTLESRQRENKLGLTEKLTFSFLIVSRIADVRFTFLPLQTSMKVVVLEPGNSLTRFEVTEDRHSDALYGSSIILRLWIAKENEEQEYCVPIRLLQGFFADNDNRPIE